MEQIISRMLADFEGGRISRRELVKSLALLGAFASSSGAAIPKLATSLRTLSLDHISYQVADYRRTRDFYADLMGMTVEGDNGTSQCELHFGESMIIARNHPDRPGELPKEERKPTVDHIAYRIDDWNTALVKGELERRGLTPRLDKGGDRSNYVSFHVEDPDGFDLQISGTAKPGDSEYEKPGKAL